jgi:hypothetical protein
VFAAGDATTVPFKQIVIAMGAGSTAAPSAFDHLIRHSAPADTANVGIAAWREMQWTLTHRCQQGMAGVLNSRRAHRDPETKRERGRLEAVEIGAAYIVCSHGFARARMFPICFPANCTGVY